MNLLALTMFFKAFRIAAFDAAQAHVQGMRPGAMHHLLMGMTAVTTVASFEAVGSIIVVSMIIVPAVCARLISSRLVTMVTLSFALAILSAMLGHLGAVELPHIIGYGSVPTSGMMAVVGGVLLVIGILVNPTHGVLPKGIRRWRFRLQTTEEDLLSLAWRLEERGRLASTDILRGDLMLARRLSGLEAGWSLRRLLSKDELRRSDDGVVLTERGRKRATTLIRSHRLWEAWLAKSAGLAPDHVHDTAMRLEHVTDEAMLEQLAEETGTPTTDPHGRSIPE